MPTLDVQGADLHADASAMLAVRRDSVGGRITVVQLPAGCTRVNRSSTGRSQTTEFLYGMCRDLCAGAGGSTLMRAQRYGRAAYDADQATAALFREVFPGQVVPRNVELTMKSALAELQAEGKAAREVTASRAALHTLYDVLRAAPDDLQFQLDQITASPHTATLVGTVAQGGEANLIAERLRTCGYNVTLPSDAQQFTLEAMRKE